MAGACVPTISKTRGESHLNAMAEAEAHQHHGRLAQAAASYATAAETAERRVDRDEARYRESRVYARLGDYEKAKQLCDELAEVDPIARRTLRARLDASRYRLLTGDEDEIKKAELRLTQGDRGKGCDLLREVIAKHETGSARRRATAKVGESCN